MSKYKYYLNLFIIILLYNYFSSTCFAATETCEKYINQCKFISELFTDIINTINNEPNDKIKFKKLHNIIEKRFDIEKITNFVIGKHRNNASRAQISRLMKEYKQYITHVYIKRLYTYEKYKMMILSVQNFRNSYFLVKTMLTSYDDYDNFINVDFKIIKNNESFYITDLIVNNVISLALNEQQVIDYKIKSEGIESLISYLKQSNLNFKS